MSEVITPQPAVPTQTPPAPPEMKPVKKGKKKAVKNAIILAIVAGVLAIGGFLLYKFLHSGGEEQGEIMAQPAQIGTIQSKVSGSGTAKAKESAAITLTQSGTVQEVP